MKLRLDTKRLLYILTAIILLTHLLGMVNRYIDTNKCYQIGGHPERVGDSIICLDMYDKLLRK